MKRLFSILLVVVAINQCANAQNDNYDFTAVAPSGQTLCYQKYCGAVRVVRPTVTGYSNISDTLIIPDSVVDNGVMYAVEYIGSHAFINCTGLTYVSIGNNVTSIGDYAFAYCSGIDSISMGYRIESIGNQAFSHCSGLTSINLGNVSTIGAYAFWNCSALESIVIPESATHIANYTFYNCQSLNSVTMSGNLTAIGSGAFAGCSNLFSIVIPATVTTIGSSAFPHQLDSAFVYPLVPPSLGTHAFGQLTHFYINCACADLYFSSQWSNMGARLITAWSDYSISANPSNEYYGRVDVDLCHPLAVINAIPNYRYHFSQWSDGDTSNPRTIELTQDTSLSSNFSKNSYTITIRYADNSDGYNNYSDNIIIDHIDTLEYLDTITINFMPDVGYYFVRWSDGDTIHPRTVVITQDTVFTAILCRYRYAIDVEVDTVVHGMVTGEGSYFYGEQCRIVARPSHGYHFTCWNDGDTTNPRYFVITQDTSFVAFFSPNQYSIIVECDTTMGMVFGSGTYNYLDTVKINAVSILDHYHFSRWSDGNYENPRTVVVANNRVFNAVFAIDQHTVTVVSNDIARGMVDGGGEYTYGTPCTITATPYTGFVFAGWSNGVTANPYTFAVLNDVELTALFISEDEVTYTVTVLSADETMGTVSGGGQAMDGGSVVIRASGNQGYHFSRWNDDNTDSVRTVIAHSDITYTAYFEANNTGRESIEDLIMDGIKAFSKDNCILIDGLNGQDVTIYTIDGRTIASLPKATEHVAIPVTTTGVYIVKIGNYPAHKVVVIR